MNGKKSFIPTFEIAILKILGCLLACYAVWVILQDLVESKKTEEKTYLIKMTDCLVLLKWGDWSLETWRRTKELSSANRRENRLTWFALQTLVSV